MQDFSIRPATVDDIPKLKQIDDVTDPSGWNEKMWTAELDQENSSIWVLTDDMYDINLIGFLVFRKEFDWIHLLKIAIEVDFRGFGWGRLMLRKLIQHAQKQKIDSIRLEARDSNKDGIKFYQKMGFVIIWKQKKYYSDGDAGYRLEYKLET